MTLEAAAGKNPVTHVGKLYTLAAGEIAANATRRVPGLKGAYCLLVSQIGRPINDPQIADVCLALESHGRINSTTNQVREIVNEQLQRFSQLRAGLLDGSIFVY
jgi:S-adenosylmethionine synthetase